MEVQQTARTTPALCYFSVLGLVTFGVILPWNLLDLSQLSIQTKKSNYLNIKGNLYLDCLSFSLNQKL